MSAYTFYVTPAYDYQCVCTVVDGVDTYRIEVWARGASAPTATFATPYYEDLPGVTSALADLVGDADVTYPADDEPLYGDPDWDDDEIPYF